MPLQSGDPFPEVTLQSGQTEQPQDISTGELFAGKKVILFGVPGAFTPACHAVHLPGYQVHAEDILSRGVDLIACVSVNDAFVMHAWGKASNVGDDILLLADGNGDLARALGLEIDISAYGMGKRSQRFAALIDNGTLSVMNVEAPGAGVDVSSAETMLGLLGG